MKLVDTLKAHPVIPVVSIDSADEAQCYLAKLKNKNIRIVEFTLRSSNALKVVEAVINDPSFADFIIGVGTVTSIAQMKQAQDIGAMFQVSPGFTQALLEHAKINNINYLPGAFTPHEIMTLQSYGINCAKFFPAIAMNGLQLLKSYASVFPSMKFCATGGINNENKQAFLSLNNVIAVGSSSI